MSRLRFIIAGSSSPCSSRGAFCLSTPPIDILDGRLSKIVSGGQTGVDRAALDAARKHGLEVGGWCPKGRRSERGLIPLCYPLRETERRDCKSRTALNVRDSDATLILTRGYLRGGTALTRRLASETGKPCWVVDLSEPYHTAELLTWLRRPGLRTLNIAGPRESQGPGIYGEALRFLERLLTAIDSIG